MSSILHLAASLSLSLSRCLSLCLCLSLSLSRCLALSLYLRIEADEKACGCCFELEIAALQEMQQNLNYSWQLIFLHMSTQN